MLDSIVMLPEFAKPGTESPSRERAPPRHRAGPDDDSSLSSRSFIDTVMQCNRQDMFQKGVVMSVHFYVTKDTEGRGKKKYLVTSI
jgi:hypothetical protein